MKTRKILLIDIIPLAMVMLFSCNQKPTYNYHIKGVIIKATTTDPLEDAVVEVYSEICQGGPFNGGCSPDPDDFHSATTNAKGEFEMAFTSEKSTLNFKFRKEYLRFFHSGLDGPFIDSGTSILNEVSMVAQTEEFEIEFEPTLFNVQEVTLGLEWDRFSGGSLQSAVVGPYPSIFGISNYINSQYKYVSLGYGEQWLKMNFDMLLEDGSSLQKTDSIWLPGRYYDINDFDFDDPRRHPVYKFTY